MNTLMETCEKLQVSERTLRDWIKRGVIVGTKNPISRRWFFSDVEIDRVKESMIPGAYKYDNNN